MNRQDFEFFARSATFNGEPLDNQIEETHISWIAFTRHHVFKIKKPVHLSFLDFSALEKRKFFCERELVLNKRFSKIYLDVLPIKRGEKGWLLGNGEGEIVDYAVQMKRMASSKRMDKMLQKNKVRKGSMLTLAKEVADFHKRAEVISIPFDKDKAKALFNDITEIENVIGEELGKGKKEFIQYSVESSNGFLDAHANRFQERIESGFKRDLHGDLHAGNIFLYKKPVLFDCIEFNDEYRQIDVLYEIAFLCMELEVKGHPEFSRQFLREYSQIIPCKESEEDAVIFIYFKCLRANIRAKVRALSIKESSNGEEKKAHLEEIDNYLSLMRGYLSKFN